MKNQQNLNLNPAISPLRGGIVHAYILEGIKVMTKAWGANLPS